MAAMINGIVMNGPTPIISIMFSVVALASPTPRINCAGCPDSELMLCVESFGMAQEV